MANMYKKQKNRTKIKEYLKKIKISLMSTATYEDHALYSYMVHLIKASLTADWQDTRFNV